MTFTEKRMRLCVGLLICNLIFIWGNSLLPGEISGKLSDIPEMVLEALLPQLDMTAEAGGIPLRKIAHFTEFTALGVLLSWLYAMLQKGKHYPLISGVAAACLDETIQMFVPDRGPSILDVLIDSSGVITGMLLLMLGYSRYRKRNL